MRVAWERENSTPSSAATKTSSRIRPGVESTVKVRAATNRSYQPQRLDHAASSLQPVGRRMGFLVGRDLVIVREGQRHVVEPFEETLFGKWIDIEVGRPSELVRDRLRG